MKYHFKSEYSREEVINIFLDTIINKELHPLYPHQTSISQYLQGWNGEIGYKAQIEKPDYQIPFLLKAAKLFYTFLKTQIEKINNNYSIDIGNMPNYNN